MKKFLLAILMVVAMLISGIAVANETVVTDTTVTSNWWDGFSNLSSVKLGYLGLDADNHDEVIDGANGITWDICASLPVMEWKNASLDAGISKAGVGFLAATMDIAKLDDLTIFPGSKFVTLNAGVFVGKNFFGTEDGIEYDDGVIYGAVVNFISW